MKKRNKSGFEKFAKKFFVVTLVVFVFGIIVTKSFESSHTRYIQQLEKEISSTNDEIDSLKMEKQELASFARLSSVASTKGYSYQNDAVAATTTPTAPANNAGQTN